MDRDGDGDIFNGDNSPPNNVIFNDGEETVLTSNFFLDRAGEVVLTLNSHGLSWKFVESIHNVSFSSIGTSIYLNCSLD